MDMNNDTMTKALEEMTEWRNALTERLVSGQDRQNGDIHLWFCLMGIRNVMSKVLAEHGIPRQDLDKVEERV